MTITVEVDEDVLARARQILSYRRRWELSGPSARQAERGILGGMDLDALIAELEEHERRLRLPGFDNDDAWQLGIVLVQLAAGRRAPVTIDLRRNGQQLFHYALPGTSADNDAWIRRKTAVVDRFGSSSYLVGQRAAAGGVTFEERFRLDPDLFAAHGGAFPVIVKGVGVIGTVAVSGLPQAEDHALVVAGLEQYLSDLTQ